MAYRADIDGLRAVAVLVVLFYHAELSCPGGFVGVDVFFVVSGYLITQIVLGKLSSGEFSLVDFYERRMRRLLPALAVMTLVSVVPAIWTLLPMHLEDFGSTLIAQPLLLVNAYFWRVMGGGYFGEFIEVRPLLHTWSLGVEEQFYLVYPLLLLLWSGRLRRARLPYWVFPAIGLLSLGCSIYLSPVRKSAAYFLLLTRAWEFLVGGAAACCGHPSFLERYRPWIAWVGIAGIALSVATLDKHSAFPGWLALVPCVGSALVLWANHGGTGSVAWLLSRGPLVRVGLMSYSVYLWHWPLLAFAKYNFLEQTATAKLALVVASLLAGLLSWRLIELPCRRGQILGTRTRLYSFVLVYLGLTLSLGLYLRCSGGMPQRWTAETLRMSRALNDMRNCRDYPIGDTSAGSCSFLLWGDSHAVHLLPMLEMLTKEAKIEGRLLSNAATAPLIRWGTRRGPSRMAKESQIDWLLKTEQTLRQNRIKTIVLAGYWSAYLRPEMKQELSETIRHFNRLGLRVYVVSDVPHYQGDVGRNLFWATLGQGSLFSGTQADLKSDPPDFDFGSLDDPSLEYRLIDVHAVFARPNGHGLVKHNGRILYLDNNHLSAEGAMLLKDVFRPLIDELKR